MATFLYKTKGGAAPKDKPRVYFTCHPEDMGHLEKICADLFQARDCAVYYTADMTDTIEDEYLESDLGRMNLFVLPVTRLLLTAPCRAMDFDFPFAKEKHRHN